MYESKNIVVYLVHDVVPPWNFSKEHVEQLQRLLPNVALAVCNCEQQFLEHLPQADCVIVWRFKQEWLALAPHLKLLATPAAGKDYFKITPPPGLDMLYGSFHGELIGETVVGSLLAMTRGILPAVTQYASDPWPRAQLAREMRPLRGSNVTILGYGSIGRWIARLLQPFGVHITGVRHKASDDCVGLDSLDEVLTKTDHLVVALPGTEDNRHFMDRRRLSLLPKHATITNIGRGVVIDEDALAEALENGALFGACLDVFETEPLPREARLRRCPRVWLTPHSSAIAPNYLNLFIEQFAQYIKNK